MSGACAAAAASAPSSPLWKVEADSDCALSRGMQGLGVCIAKALNHLMEHRGAVFDDHYHSRLLRTPTELVNAIAYVLGNAAHHFGGEPGRDPFSSGAYDDCARKRILAEPIGWLCGPGGAARQGSPGG